MGAVAQGRSQEWNIAVLPLAVASMCIRYSTEAVNTLIMPTASTDFVKYLGNTHDAIVGASFFLITLIETALFHG